jgi:DNA-binding transcriptional regulator YiaG
VRTRHHPTQPGQRQNHQRRHAYRLREGTQPAPPRDTGQAGGSAELAARNHRPHPERGSRRSERRSHRGADRHGPCTADGRGRRAGHAHHRHCARRAPKDSEPEFAQKASTVLADLRKLEAVASNAARNAKGAPSVVLALSSVRRTYNELMLRAARSPSATLGQRLYGARHRTELSIEEAANAAGIPTAVLEDAESERPVPPDAAVAIEMLIAQLAMS